MGTDPHQLPGDLGGLPFGLLHKDPDPPVSGEHLRQGGLLGVLFLDSGGRSGGLLPGQFLQNLQFLGGEEHLQGIGGADLHAFKAADALLGEDDRFPRIAHLYGIHGAGALAPGAAGDALSRDGPGCAPGLLYLLWFSHG